MGDSPIIIVRGKRACPCMEVAIPRVETGLRALGVIRADLSGLINQGAWNGGAGAVAASAGTHAGGGVWDVEPSLVDTDAKRACWWGAGIVPFYRITADAPVSQWPPHGHVVTIGCPHLAPSAAKQVVSARNGKNALANNGPFRGAVPSPILAWDQIQEDDMPSADEIAAAVWNGSTWGGETAGDRLGKAARAAEAAASQTRAISRGGVDVALRQEVADSKTMLIEQSGLIRGLTEAVAQLAVGGSVDLAAVEAAAKRGAQEALRGATVSVDLGGGVQ